MVMDRGLDTAQQYANSPRMIEAAIEFTACPPELIWSSLVADSVPTKTMRQSTHHRQSVTLHPKSAYVQVKKLPVLIFVIGQKQVTVLVAALADHLVQILLVFLSFSVLHSKGDRKPTN